MEKFFKPLIHILNITDMRMFICLFIAFLLLNSSLVDAQNPVGFYGYGNNGSWANHLSMNPDGTKFAMAGTISGPKQHFLVTDNNGNVLMSKVDGQDGEFFSSDLDINDDIYLVGYKGAIGSETKNLIKVNGSGTLQYAKEYGNGQLRYVLDDGNYLALTGFDSKSGTGKPCIIKVNKSDGSIVWYKEYAVNGKTQVDSYVIRKLGTNYYITGTLNPKSNKQSFILCVKQSDGSIVWCKTYQAGNSPNFTGMSINNSNLIVCGVSNEMGAQGNLFVVNVNPNNGNIIWQRRLNAFAGWHLGDIESGNSWGINCVMDPYGYVVVACEDGPDIDSPSYTNFRGGLFVKLKISDGTTSWIKRYHTSNGDGFHGLVISNCNYIGSGWFHSTSYNYGLVISDSAGVVGGSYPQDVTSTKTNTSITLTVADVTSTTTNSSLTTISSPSYTLSNSPMTKSVKASASSPSCNVPLPIELITFDGQAQDVGNLLHWETASEHNNDYFILEATTDGMNYTQIGTVKGAGNSTKDVKYEFLDRSPLGNMTYYRLSQVDFNGQTEKFEPISIQRKSSSEIYVSPNPVIDVLHISTEAKVAGEYTFTFVGVNGQRIEQKHYIEQGNNNFNINTSNLAEGFYFLQIEDVNGAILSTTKLVKE